MSDEFVDFTQKYPGSWENWETRIAIIKKYCDSQPDSFFKFIKNPPASEETILEAEKKLGAPLPRDLRYLIKQYSSHMEHRWHVKDDDSRPFPDWVRKGKITWDINALELREPQRGLIDWYLDDEMKEKTDPLTYRLTDFLHMVGRGKYQIYLYSLNNGDEIWIDVIHPDYCPVLAWSHNGMPIIYLADSLIEFIELYSFFGFPAEHHEFAALMKDRGNETVQSRGIPAISYARKWRNHIGLLHPSEQARRSHPTA